MVTLTLAIMYVGTGGISMCLLSRSSTIRGGAQLPMPATFASTGAVAASILIVLVGVANDYTSRMLCKQAYFVGRQDYEKLGYAVGGRLWQLMVEVSVFLLLYGTMVSAIQQVGEIWYGCQQDVKKLSNNARLPSGLTPSTRCLPTAHRHGSRIPACSCASVCFSACPLSS